jgi:hypothetical protein
MFELDERLEIVLRAVASRHPGSLVEINQDLLDRSGLWEGLCPVEQVLERLQVQAPQELQAPARVLIDDGPAISAIYLLDRSQEVPALYLYSGRSDERSYRQGLHETVVTLERGDPDLVPSQRSQQSSQEAAQERNSTTSLAYSFPLRAGKTQEWRDWGEEILGPRRREYEAFSRRLGLKAQRAYLQQTPQGGSVIIYLEGHDLQRTFRELQTSQDPFAVWVRQKVKDLLDGFDLAHTSPGSLSKLVFDGSSLVEEEESGYVREEVEHATSVARVEILAQDGGSDDVREEMERLGMISP